MTYGDRVMRALMIDLIVLAGFVIVALPFYLAGWYDAKRYFRRTSALPGSEEKEEG